MKLAMNMTFTYRTSQAHLVLVHLSTSVQSRTWPCAHMAYGAIGEQVSISNPQGPSRFKNPPIHLFMQVRVHVLALLLKPTRDFSSNLVHEIFKFKIIGDNCVHQLLVSLCSVPPFLCRGRLVDELLSKGKLICRNTTRLCNL